MKTSTQTNPLRAFGLAVVLLLLSHPVTAQSQFYLGFGGLVGTPRADFAGYGASEGYGGSFVVGYSPGSIPIMVGAHIGGMIYGYESRWELLNDRIPDLEVQVINTNNIVQGHAFVRLQPNTGRIKPYFEVLAGANLFFTVTYIDDDYEGHLSTTNHEDAALSFGPGGGLVVVLWNGSIENGRPFDLVLDLGLSYLWGAEADYLVEGAIERSPGAVIYDISRSQTNLLTGRIGIAFLF